jgi:hypothetical protein
VGGNIQRKEDKEGRKIINLKIDIKERKETNE